MFRIAIILLAALLIFRLVAILFRGKGNENSRKARRAPRGKQVGEGRIIKDEPDENSRRN